MLVKAKATQTQIDAEIQNDRRAGAQQGISSGSRTGNGERVLQVRTSAEVNQAMAQAGNIGAWGGTTVTTVAVPKGTQFNMVVSEGQAQALMAGTPAFGSWGTPDIVPNQNFARNNLAITPAFKSDVSFVVRVETTASQTLNRGTVGRVGNYSGGANQVELLGNKNLKIVGPPQSLPKGR